ncbi:gliding motility protein RemB [Sphingobacterium griseoflavum]|uniref:Gliding motility protein RemB n=1 Tax=Sphingobacterium griseoflavum TaxID=1474952 RepID=A0ABQ3HZA5_9SPHI|nr:gliding motility protein RemB [Sphingobacterium griseoflavum]GHE39261.1 hypothetical protein GCM10017764_23100 [Sphingobacterium griseoflavum]
MRKLSLFLFVLLYVQQVAAQIYYQPYSFQQYHRYGKAVYGEAGTHTAVKPFVVGKQLDSVYDIVPRDSSRGWLHRKLFQEHLIEVRKDDHRFYADFLPDFVVGRQTGTNSKTLWTNSRGVQAGLSVKDNFNLYFNFFETQARFPTHIDSTATALGGLPGQGFSKNLENHEYDWMNTTVHMSYRVSDGFQVELAYDKLHIGDGYRSMLLSDNPYNFTYAKFSGQKKRFQYNSVWAYMLDRRNPRVQLLENQQSVRLGNASKYAAFQYIDYLASDKLTVGLFHSLIWSRYSEDNTKKVNGGLGLNVKYQPWDKYMFYGQMFADDLSKISFNKDRDRRTAYQLGARAFDVFAVNNLNITAEFNQAAPYTYQHSNNRINHSNDGEPLAHPNGANFREILGIATYRWKRVDLYGQTMFARYGTDPSATANFGGDIFKSQQPAGGFRIGQGQAIDLFYNELRVAYVLNPKYNLRWELGLINRQQKPLSGGDRVNANIFTIGLRSSFRTFQTEY